MIKKLFSCKTTDHYNWCIITINLFGSTANSDFYLSCNSKEYFKVLESRKCIILLCWRKLRAAFFP